MGAFEKHRGMNLQEVIRHESTAEGLPWPRARDVLFSSRKLMTLLARRVSVLDQMDILIRMLSHGDIRRSRSKTQKHGTILAKIPIRFDLDMATWGSHA